MEAIYLVPKYETYDEVRQLMGALSDIRPKIIQTLLENCNSIKVKRVFMLLAERYSYPWLKDLDLTKVNFGKGKREFIKNGYLDKKYQITIPRDADNDPEV